MECLQQGLVIATIDPPVDGISGSTVAGPDEAP